MSEDTIKVNMNIYDIPILVEQLEKLHQENKQLKSILTELEEWLEMMEEKETIGTYSMVQDKIQELKEKYK